LFSAGAIDVALNRSKRGGIVRERLLSTRRELVLDVKNQ
jgi:hypothetical protein